MKWLGKAILMAVWLIVATHLYAIAWSFYPDYFPDYPERAADVIIWLCAQMHVYDIESVTNAYYLVLSFLPVTAATFLGLLGWRLLRRHRKRQ
ncbi:hypothetical protein [Cupriavidus campinensis]